MAKTIVNVLLFIVAGVLFFIGLGLGLQYSPSVGTALWIAAGVIVVLNVLWMNRRPKQEQE